MRWAEQKALILGTKITACHWIGISPTLAGVNQCKSCINIPLHVQIAYSLTHTLGLELVTANQHCQVKDCNKTGCFVCRTYNAAARVAQLGNALAILLATIRRLPPRWTWHREPNWLSPYSSCSAYKGHWNCHVISHAGSQAVLAPNWKTLEKTSLTCLLLSEHIG